MSFFDFLDKIRSQPRYIRIQILWFLVFVLMSLIISFWIASLSDSSLSQKASLNEELVKPLGEAKQELPSLMKVVKDSLNVFFERKIEAEKEEEIVEEEPKQNQPAKLPLRP